jgi:hypothetical protein
MVNPTRIYDKGENRKKHQGTSREARIVHEDGKEVGKCPKGFSLEAAQKLLVEGAIEERKSRQPDVPFRLWNVHNGVVYQARTSDSGRTWHGWSVGASHIPCKIRRQLEDRAIDLEEAHLLKEWLSKRF